MQKRRLFCWALISARLASTALIYGAKSARALAEATLKKPDLDCRIEAVVLSSKISHITSVNAPRML